MDTFTYLLECVAVTALLVIGSGVALVLLAMFIQGVICFLVDDRYMRSDIGREIQENYRTLSSRMPILERQIGQLAEIELSRSAKRKGKKK